MGCARSWLLHGGVTYITRHWCFCYLLGPFLNCVAEASCQMLKSGKVEMLLLSAIHLHGHRHPGHIVQPVRGRIEVTQREEARRLMEHCRMPRLLVSVRDDAPEMGLRCTHLWLD